MMGVTGAPRRRRGEIGFSERRQTILGEGFIIFYRALSGQFRCHHSNLGTVKKLSNMLQHNDNMRLIFICYVVICYVMLGYAEHQGFAGPVWQLKTMLLITAAATALPVLLLCRSAGGWAEGQRR